VAGEDAAAWVDAFFQEAITQARDANPRMSVHGSAMSSNPVFVHSVSGRQILVVFARRSRDVIFGGVGAPVTQ